MKPTTIKQTFKIVRATNSAAPEELRGKKRETVEYQINMIEPDDLPAIPAEQTILIINAALENHAKKLFAENTFDWNFVPSLEQVTVQAVFDDLTAERKTGKRILTNASLAAFAEVYAELAVSKLGKSAAGAASGAKIIQQKLAPIMGNSAALTTFTSNLEQVLVLPDFDADEHGEVVQALLELIEQSSQTEEIALDAL